MRHLAWTVTLAAALAAPAVATADCTCRAGGRDYGLGGSACLQTRQGYRLATCEMVVNNTSWRVSATPCVDARGHGATSSRINAVGDPRAGGG
jgi:hypothetical protein